MAGGRPEYLPVLVAAVEAFVDPESGSEQLQAASGSAFPVVIVNGPIGDQIRLNSGFGSPIGEPALALVKSSAPPTSNSIAVGDAVTYTVVITNLAGANPSPAYHVIFTDTL